jgi:hypothetical protein
MKTQFGKWLHRHAKLSPTNFVSVLDVEFHAMIRLPSIQCTVQILGMLSSLLVLLNDTMDLSAVCISAHVTRFQYSPVYAFMQKRP